MGMKSKFLICVDDFHSISYVRNHLPIGDIDKIGGGMMTMDELVILLVIIARHFYVSPGVINRL